MSLTSDVLQTDEAKSAGRESPMPDASIDDIDNELLLLKRRFDYLTIERRRLSGLADVPVTLSSPLQEDPQQMQQTSFTSPSAMHDVKNNFKPVIPRWDGQRSTWPAFKMRLIYYFRASGLFDALMDPNCTDQRSHMVMHVLMTVTSNTIYFTTVETESGRSNAATAWTSLCKRLDPLAQVESDRLRKELENLEQFAGTDVDEYIASLERLFAKLTSLGHVFTDNQKTNKLIDSVSDEFKEVCSRIREDRMLDPNALPYDIVCARLRTYQLYNEAQRPSIQKKHARAFGANFSGPRPSRKANKASGESRHPTDEHQRRHDSQKSRNGKPKGKNRGPRNRSSRPSGRRSSSRQDNQRVDPDAKTVKARGYPGAMDSQDPADRFDRSQRPHGRDPFTMTPKKHSRGHNSTTTATAAPKSCTGRPIKRARKTVMKEQRRISAIASADARMLRSESYSSDDFFEDDDDDSDDERDIFPPWGVLDDPDQGDFQIDDSTGIWENVPLSGRFERNENHFPIKVDGFPIKIRSWPRVFASGRPLGSELFVHAQLSQAIANIRAHWTGLTEPLCDSLLQPEELLGLITYDAMDVVAPPRAEYVLDLAQIPSNWDTEVFMRILEASRGPMGDGLQIVGKSPRQRVFPNVHTLIAPLPNRRPPQALLQIIGRTVTGTTRLSYRVPNFGTSGLSIIFAGDRLYSRLYTQEDHGAETEIFESEYDNELNLYRIPRRTPISHDFTTETSLRQSFPHSQTDFSAQSKGDTQTRAHYQLSAVCEKLLPQYPVQIRKNAPKLNIFHPLQGAM